VTINQTIFQTLLNAKSRLSEEAISLLRSFIDSKKYHKGGFIDRSGKPDPYYSVFGYTLSYLFDIEFDTKKEQKALKRWEEKNKIDFVHAISLIRCYYLLEAIDLAGSFGKVSTTLASSKFLQNLVGKKVAKKIQKKHSSLLKTIDSYKSDNEGFNHLEKHSKYASVYANFLAYGLFEDLYLGKGERIKIAESCMELMLENGSFVNHLKSKQGISSTTAAGIILLNSIGKPIFESSEWLKEQIQSHGGFLAGEDVPVADVLSTATSLLALGIVGTADDGIKGKAVEFVNLHWHDAGGFFGSIADQIPDVEYTFYGLLTLGV
jgi:geranylgeranyl transferase type-2 subunit beta